MGILKRGDQVAVDGLDGTGELIGSNSEGTILNVKMMNMMDGRPRVVNVPAGSVKLCESLESMPKKTGSAKPDGRIMTEKYNETIMQALRCYREIDEDDTSRDDEIMAMDRIRAFKQYFNWNLDMPMSGDWVIDVLRQFDLLKEETS